ncbi:MAG: hypothetical protein LBK74_05855 [Treponema sp.]|jgi:hypothetical protein|nr:hypothetical protein [Treponema sp.]
MQLVNRSIEKKEGNASIFLSTVQTAVALGNCEDGRELADRIADGLLQIVVRDNSELTVNIFCKNHRLEIMEDLPVPVRARIEYANVTVAAGIMSGFLNQFVLTVHEDYVVRGFIPMIDAFEKLLYRANSYIN